MVRAFARICSVCKEDHALITSAGPPDGDVCVCDRCLETVAKDHFVWICLSCREVYLENKKLLLEREADPALRQYYRDLMTECVIHGLESCLNCSGEGIFETAGDETGLLCC